MYNQNQIQVQTLLDLIGNTPLIEIKKVWFKSGVRILAKLEAFNPGGSIKDRAALAMVEAAESSGLITSDKVIIEATSGNTGIGLAMVCAVKGYRLMLIMPESASEERKRILQAYGAKLVLTPAHLGTDGAIEEAYRLAREYPNKYILMDQYNNQACVEAHYKHTGSEIWQQTGGKITHFVGCLGTSGTVMGVTKYLKEVDSQIKCIAVEPGLRHKIQGLKNMQESYPPGIYNPDLVDEILRVEDEEAFELCRRLAREEGLLVGMSSGAALAGAIKVAKRIENGVIVTIFPDSGERYLSTSLFLSPEKRGIEFVGLDGKKVLLCPQDNAFNFFTFGPTLDDLKNLNVWRRIVFLEVLARYFQHIGIESRVIVGISDFDDRTLNYCRLRKVSREDLIRESKKELAKVCQKFGLQKIEFAFFSERIEIALEICTDLLTKGKAYEKLRSVYFDVRRQDNYGYLGLKDIQLRPKQDIIKGRYLKDNPEDFTLLKRASLQDLKEGEVLNTKWGKVRPSWYLQQASILSSLQKPVQMVVAGEGQVFPHLDNLISLLKNKNKELPKAWGVVLGVKDEVDLDIFSLSEDKLKVLKGWLVSSSIQKRQKLTLESLKMWQKNYQKISDLWFKLNVLPFKDGDLCSEIEGLILKIKGDLRQLFESGFKIHLFWSNLFNFIKQVNYILNNNQLTKKDVSSIKNILQELNKIFDLFEEERISFDDNPPEQVKKILLERKQARLNKNFALSDKLREKIEDLGYKVVDMGTETVVLWHHKEKRG
ncbi:cysteine synthase [Desulfonauticus submarinus]